MSFSEIIIVTLALSLGFGFVIFIHELGHFLLARRAGIVVEVFSIGFGPKLFSFKRGDTTYQLSLLPFGGFVKMVGEDPQDEAGAASADGYAGQSVWDRFLVVIAGPSMNILFACVLMPLVFLIGRERPAYEQHVPVLQEVARYTSVAQAGFQAGDQLVQVNDAEVATWSEVQDALVLAGGGDVVLAAERDGKRIEAALEPSFWGRGLHPLAHMVSSTVIGSVSEGMPAAQAGLRAGDTIVALAGIPITSFTEFSMAIAQGRSVWFWQWAARAWDGNFAQVLPYLQGGPLPVTVEREGKQLTVEVRPQYDAEYERYLMGVRANDAMWDQVPMVTQQYGVVDSLRLGMSEVWRMLGLTGKFLKRLVSEPEHHVESLAGPVRIVSMFAQVAREGLSPFFYFLAFFNLQLGLLNLLPIPVLDGGHIVFLAIEAVTGRPVSLRARAIAQQIGMALLLTMLVFVTMNDIGSFF